MRSLAGEIDIKAHTHNMRILSEKGIEGFVVGGSNGDGDGSRVTSGPGRGNTGTAASRSGPAGPPHPDKDGQ